MAQLSNTPQSQTPIRLEARKSFSLMLWFENEDAAPLQRVDLTGATVHFDMAKRVHKGGTSVISQALSIDGPIGLATLNLQAADLNLTADTYDYMVTLVTAQDFSIPVMKGEIEILRNAALDDSNVFSGANPSQSLTIELKRNHRVYVKVPQISAGLRIGDVTTLDSGESATAAIRGAFPNQFLDLGIPQGATTLLPSIADSLISNIISDPASATRGNLDGRYAAVTALATVTANLAKIAAKLPFDPHDYGALGDGSHDDTSAIQAAIDACSAAGGGYVILHQNKVYKAAGIILKQGVYMTTLASGGRFPGGAAAAAVIVPPASFTGWIIDTPDDGIINVGVIGINVVGGVVSGSVPNRGGIRFKNVTWGVVENCSVASTSLGSMYIIGTANIVRFNACQNYWTWRTLTTYEGALTVAGTDALVEGNQSNGAMSITDPSVSTDPATMYRCANLMTLLTSIIIGGNGEFAEVGWRISLFESVTFNLRADTNPGPGVIIVPSSFGGAVGGTRHTGMTLLSNCLSPAANNLHAHILVYDYAHEFDSIMFGPDWTGGPNAPAYGIDDRVSFVGFLYPQIRQLQNKYRNMRSVFNAAAPPWKKAEGKTTFGFFSYADMHADMDLRPRAFYAGGKSGYDIKLGTIISSDGTYWRDGKGEIVGDILPFRVTELTEGSVDWVGFAGTATMSTEYRAEHSKAKTLKFTCTPTGVGFTICAATSDSSYASPVTPGQTVRASAQVTGPPGKSPIAQVGMLYYDSAFTYLGQSTATMGAVAQTGAAPTKIVNEVVIPAGVAYVTFAVYGQCTGLASGDAFYASDFMLDVVSKPRTFVLREPVIVASSQAAPTDINTEYTCLLTAVCTLTLPTPVNRRHPYRIKNLSGDAVNQATVAAPAGLLEGGTTYLLSDGESVDLYPINGQWRVY